MLAMEKFQKKKKKKSNSSQIHINGFSIPPTDSLPIHHRLNPQERRKTKRRKTVKKGAAATGKPGHHHLPSPSARAGSSHPGRRIWDTEPPPPATVEPSRGPMARERRRGAERRCRPLPPAEGELRAQDVDWRGGGAGSQVEGEGERRRRERVAGGGEAERTRERS